ncbi:MAG TPA: mechanosensitive ion channel domain-containing protein [Puia sp.]|uniref:mechanosensitive ion channel family protein n=1 Tax=Puia sp. TaxID=2045100 RepID=UPI002C964ACF|nr:mechanosensitive ion channel domain-containing protein [Puia sp.]HVU96339.1 mechanosensitive ion channel domain-containing protein [Puia sp.]
MKHLLLCLTVLVATGILHAQDTVKPHPAKPTAIKEDSARTMVRRKSEVYREAFKHVRRKFDSTLFMARDTASNSDFAEDLERVYQILSHIPVVTESFGHLPDIDNKLDLEDSALDIIKERMSQSDRTLNIRNLQMFNTLLDELDRNVRGYTRTLNHYDDELDTVRKEIANLRKDTLILHIFRDSALKDTFRLQLQQLKAKWRQVDSLVALNGNYVNALKSEASAHTITIADLIYRVDQALKAVGTRAFGKERRYIWEPRSPNASTFSRNSFQKSVDSERQLARFYFANNRTNRLWLLITGAVFFFWIWTNFRTLKRMNKLQAIEGYHFSFVNPYPIAASFVFVLSLAPLFDLHAPAIYIESIEFLLIIVLSFILKKHLSRFLFYGWCIFLLLFLLLPVIRILGLPFAAQRWAELILDAASVGFASFYLFGKHRMGKQLKFVYVAASLYLLLNALAVLCNLFGRVTLSQIFGATAVYSFAQTVSLAVFVKLVVETFLLQIIASRVRKGYPETFDIATVSRSIYRIVLLLAIFLWLIVFSTNLNLFDAINDWLTDFFGTSREVGNFSFTLGGLLLFLGIIWLANFLQRFIAYFFGDTGDDAAMDDRGQRSRLLITRLVLLIGGFLLAVAASGLSVDRITVILGALGVGVGLGLQNIVNNFVSGIILIFDRPVRIGDTVEIGDKRGRVKEIGIRSSTLLTDDGAEVIIPNGDVLSNHIVNWTLSNNHVRVALTFTVDKTGKQNLDPKAIAEVVKKNSNVLDRRDPEVMVTTTGAKTLEVKVYFWVKDIVKTPNTTGEIRTSLYHYFDEKGIIVN